MKERNKKKEEINRKSMETKSKNKESRNTTSVLMNPSSVCSLSVVSPADSHASEDVEEFFTLLRPFLLILFNSCREFDLSWYFLPHFCSGLSCKE